ncbi:MAG: hypothetical protein ACOVSI_16105, partial [Gemmatimonas sp.]
MALPDDPLQHAQQAALVLLSRLMLFLWTPIFAFGIVMRWGEVEQRPLFVLIMTGVPLLGGILRLPNWGAERRAWIAIVVIMVMSLP